MPVNLKDRRCATALELPDDSISIDSEGMKRLVNTVNEHYRATRERHVEQLFAEPGGTMNDKPEPTEPKSKAKAKREPRNLQAQIESKRRQVLRAIAKHQAAATKTKTLGDQLDALEAECAAMTEELLAKLKAE